MDASSKTQHCVAIIPNTYRDFCDGPSCLNIHYPDNIGGLVEASSHADLTGATEILIMLPRISRDYLDTLLPSLQNLGQLASPKVYVVPPPPVYHATYETVIKELMA